MCSDYLEHNEEGIPELYQPNIRSSVNMENVNIDVPVMFLLYILLVVSAIDCVVYDCEQAFYMCIGNFNW